jgi:hypothetical protein
MSLPTKGEIYYLQYNYLFTLFMVTGQLLRCPAAYCTFIHEFCCGIRHFFITFAVAIDYMNVHFLIMHHQISTRNKRHNTFSDKLNTLVKFNCQHFICVQSVYSVQKRVTFRLLGST